MRKHIYFHSSNYEYTRTLRDDEDFEGTFQYPSHEFGIAHEHEYGRFKTDKHYLHLLIGNVKYEGCPWCSSPVVMKKIKDFDGVRHAIYCMECLNCGARGSILNVSSKVEQDPEGMQEIESILKTRFRQRLPWDKDLVNYYDITQKTLD